MLFSDQLLFLYRKSVSLGSEHRKSHLLSLSPENEDRYYTTRGSLVGCEEKEKEKGTINGFWD